MGLYFNPGNLNFNETVRSSIYVDKTMMLKVTNDLCDTTDKYICISRPRGFGKTIAGNMLCAFIKTIPQ